MDINEAWDNFKCKIREMEEKHIPMSQIRTGRNKLPLNRETVALIKEKGALSRKFVQTKDPEIRKRYNHIRNKVTKEVRKARKNFERNLAKEAKTNPKKIWKYINSKSKTREGIGELCKDPTDPKSEKTDKDEEKANILADYFSSVFTNEAEGALPNIPTKQITQNWKKIEIKEEVIGKLLKELKEDKSPGMDKMHPTLLKELNQELSKPLSLIFRKSLEEAKVPDDWKKARVSAIHKKGSRAQAGNYRPVSITSIVCKILEKIVRNHIMSHFKDNKLFTKKQFGFMGGRSTSLQLLKVLDLWTEALDQGYDIDCIYMDYQKAFDTVPHRRLLKN